MLGTLLSIIAALPAASLPNITLDIYNRDQAFVREVRPVNLDEGYNRIQFNRIAEGIYGHTAVVRPLEHPERIATLALAFTYDLLNLDKLMHRYIGEWFAFTTEDADYQGRLLRFDDTHLFLQPDTTDPLLQVVEKGKLKEMFFPGLPDGIVSEPTLVWEVEAKRKFTGTPVEINYLTSDITWLCDYRLELEPDGGILEAVFTIDNRLPLSFPAARVTLIAGETHRAADPAGASGDASIPAEVAKPSERFFEYHRWELDRPVDLSGNRTVQLPFFVGRKIKVVRRFVFPHISEDGEVLVNLRLLNSAADGLGEPLPEGDVGIYERTLGGALSFVGEDHINPLPVGARADLTVGRAFDISARRIRMTQVRPERDRHEERWRVELTSARPTVTVVEVEHRAFGYYDILSATANGDEITPHLDESHRIFFPVTVPPHQKVILEYVISYGL